MVLMHSGVLLYPRKEWTPVIFERMDTTGNTVLSGADQTCGLGAHIVSLVSEAPITDRLKQNTHDKK